MMVAVPSPASTANAPVHVAIIMDGNGRWAQSRGLPRTAGHRQGMEAVRETVRTAKALGIDFLTLYGFSSENWNRPADEVQDLMGLLRLYLAREVEELKREGVRMRFIGNRTRLPADIVDLIGRSEAETSGNTQLTLVIALSYGSRDEIVEAARGLARRVRDGSLDPEAISEEALERELSTRGIPDPDLIIRTSGEQRLSNFLLWQAAYSELIFTDRLWPDFKAADLAAALEEFRRRERRYGAVVG